MIKNTLNIYTINGKFTAEIEEINPNNFRLNSMNLPYLTHYFFDGVKIHETSEVRNSNICVFHDESFMKYEDEPLILQLIIKKNKKYFFHREDQCPESIMSFTNSSITQPVLTSDILEKFKASNDLNYTNEINLATLRCEENSNTPSICSYKEENDLSLLYSPKLPKSCPKISVVYPDPIKTISDMGYDSSEQNLTLLVDCDYDVQKFVDEYHRRSLME